MKKVFVLLITLVVFVSCKDDKTSEAEMSSEEKTTVAEPGKTLKQSDGLIAIQGDFLYVDADKAAVFKTPTQMYGVVIDDKMNELNEQVKQYKADQYTMVPVTLRVRMIENNVENQWKQKIEIKEILKVSKPSPEENDVIKLGSK
ncbi:hypothetical protein [Psychroserpens luteolus]|uniref:hypothetical protein n=1 Tax=Psychroserpens luteolus TaxID=2855840 RepID=UPI001E38938C|nr:hypothetical protein [Psychroserpens luteolus]MCD2258445.1 hypothetical protein [Psychroserpens luteolus]